MLIQETFIGIIDFRAALIIPIFKNSFPYTLFKPDCPEYDPLRSNLHKSLMWQKQFVIN